MRDQYLYLNIENKTEFSKTVKLFSLDEPIPDGVTITTQPSVGYESLLKELTSTYKKVPKLRLTNIDTWDLLTSPIKVIHKGKDRKAISYPITPFLYFSKYQQQQSIVEITPINLIIEEGFELELDLKPNSSRNVFFYISDVLHISNAKPKDVTEFNKRTPEAYEKSIPILLENQTDTVQEISLFDLSIIEDRFSDEEKRENIKALPVKVTVPVSNYLRMLEQMKFQEDWFLKMPSLKILLSSYKNLHNVMYDKKGNIFSLPDHLDPYQTQSDMLDCHTLGYKWDKQNPLIVPIEPQTKMFLLFYKANKEYQISERERFVAHHNAELRELGLTVVPLSEVN